MTELALCILQLPGDRFALQRRSKDVKMSPGLLGLFGGHIDPGELPENAVLRELGEETSLHIEELQISLVGRYEFSNDAVVVFLYKTNITDETFEVFEGDGAEIYTREELRLRDDVSFITQSTLVNGKMPD
jgi:8-oxo-dGTP diphosphatase